MKVTILRVPFLSAVSTLIHATSVTADCILSVRPRAVLSAGSREGGAAYQLDGVTVNETGEGCFSLSSVATVLRRSSDETVAIDTDATPGRIRLKMGLGVVELPSRDAAGVHGYPPENGTTITLASAEFRKLVSRVVFAADRRLRTGDWATSAVKVSLTKARFMMEATDTFGLAMARLELPAPGETVVGCLVPARSVRTWSELARTSATVDLAFLLHHLAVESGAFMGWASIGPGPYPDLKSVVRRRRPNWTTVKTQSLRQAVARALVAAELDQGMDPRDRRLIFRTEPKLLTVSATSEQAAARFPVRASLGSGKTVAVPLYGQRVAEYLDSISEEDVVTMRWQDAREAVEFATGGSWYLAAPFIERADVGPPGRAT